MIVALLFTPTVSHVDWNRSSRNNEFCGMVCSVFNKVWQKVWLSVVIPKGDAFIKLPLVASTTS